MDPLLTLVSLSIVPPLMVLIAVFNRKIAGIATTARDTDSHVYSIVQWGMASIKHIQAFTKEAEEHHRFMTASIAALQAHRRLYFWQIGLLCSDQYASRLRYRARHLHRRVAGIR
jgi:ATP-binding cassette subfamily B protein